MQGLGEKLYNYREGRNYQEHAYHLANGYVVLGYTGEEEGEGIRVCIAKPRNNRKGGGYGYQRTDAHGSHPEFYRCDWDFVKTLIAEVNEYPRLT